jgi:hypothetical protein
MELNALFLQSGTLLSQPGGLKSFGLCIRAVSHDLHEQGVSEPALAGSETSGKGANSSSRQPDRIPK